MSEDNFVAISTKPLGDYFRKNPVDIIERDDNSIIEINAGKFAANRNKKSKTNHTFFYKFKDVMSPFKIYAYDLATYTRFCEKLMILLKPRDGKFIINISIKNKDNVSEDYIISDDEDVQSIRKFIKLPIITMITCNNDLFSRFHKKYNFGAIYQFHIEHEKTNETKTIAEAVEISKNEKIVKYAGKPKSNNLWKVDITTTPSYQSDKVYNLSIDKKFKAPVDSIVSAITMRDLFVNMGKLKKPVTEKEVADICYRILHPEEEDTDENTN